MVDIVKDNIVVALAGNPNCGKSTIFNALTGSTQRVGNYPGITVEKKEGLKNYKGYSISFIDLPGTYSLSAYSDEEIVARDFLLSDEPDVIIDVIDASNMERNLYLFTQIIELKIPVIIVLNMIDILFLHGESINQKEMSKLLGVSVVATVANKGTGICDILCSILDIYENKGSKKQVKAKVNYGEIIENEIYKLEVLVSKNCKLSKFSKSWLTLRLLENEPSILELVSNAYNKVEILCQLKKSKDYIKRCFHENAETVMIDKRYSFINDVVKIVIKKNGQKKFDVTEIIDNFVLNKYFGFPIFVVVMYIIFKFTFIFSNPVVNFLGKIFEWFGSIVSNIIPNGPVQSLIVDGIFGGVCGVLGFFPLILFMFFAIAFFEDSGYMPRAAFVMNKIMNRFGLHGKSFLPLMLSTNGCAVPGILATRTLDSKRDRLITMFVVSFMICGAKLPVFALIISAFFPVKYQVAIMFFMYILSIVIALSVAKLLSVTVLTEEESHFVMELPHYHIPTLKGLFFKTWERGWLYVKKCGTIIVFISILIWVLFGYPKISMNENLSKIENISLQMQYSIAGRIGKIVDPLFKPIGMDGNRAIALIAGFAAKELIISTLGTIYSIENVDSKNVQSLKNKISLDKSWSPLKGITFLIFCLIYVPCIASVIVFFKEAGSSYKWLIILILGNTIFAWLASCIVFQFGKLLKIGM
ncbi:MAG: ferrous iron transport protein B [Endomicrobium sp.]|jgi:ferrous iron transport protein B|nr:ferrous iron transport protein B [Endomicrobium sp.]